MEIRAIDYRGSIVDGPGIRTVLYVQGCEKHCLGCHNHKTWRKGEGIIKSVQSLEEEIRRESLTKNITISGGEPLLQWKEVSLLAQLLADFNIALYTGWELEHVPRELLEHIDYLKVGPFIEAKKSSVIPYAGSTNQKFLLINRKIADEYEELISRED